MDSIQNRLYNLYVQVKILSNEKPLLFTWWSSERLRVEGCLVSCHCQKLNLQNNGEKQDEENHLSDSHETEDNISEALKKADIVSLMNSAGIESVVCKPNRNHKKQNLGTFAPNNDVASPVVLGQMPLLILPTTIASPSQDFVPNTTKNTETPQSFLPQSLSFAVSVIKSTSDMLEREEQVRIPPKATNGAKGTQASLGGILAKDPVQDSSRKTSVPENEVAPDGNSCELHSRVKENVIGNDATTTEETMKEREVDFPDESEAAEAAENSDEDYVAYSINTTSGGEKHSHPVLTEDHNFKGKRKRKMQKTVSESKFKSKENKEVSDKKSRKKASKTETISVTPKISRRKANKPTKVKPLPPFQPFTAPVSSKPIVVMRVEDLAEYKDLVRKGKIKEDVESNDKEEENKWAKFPGEEDDEMDILPAVEDDEEEPEIVPAIEEAYKLCQESIKTVAPRSEISNITKEQEVSAVSDTLAETAKVLQGGSSTTPANIEDALRNIAAGMSMQASVEERPSAELEKLVLEAGTVGTDGKRETPIQAPSGITIPSKSIFTQEGKAAHLLRSPLKTTVENVIAGAFESATSEKPEKSKFEIQLEEYKEFKSQEFLEKYRKSQVVDGGFFILCEFCAKPTSNKSYKKHVECCHSKEERDRNFMCSICGKRFLNEQGLEKHRLTHTNVRFQCSFCDKTYKQDYNRKNHERKHQGLPKKYKNPPANKTKYPGNLKFIQCEVCGKIVRSTSMRAHMLGHDNRRFTCEVCGKSLKVGCRYQHMQTHIDAKTHVCKTCNKNFSCKGSLRVHMRIHTKEKPLKCRYCSETFARNQARINHERRHTGEKPYKCEICNKYWRDHTTAWCHMRRHHPGHKIINLKKSQKDPQNLLGVRPLEPLAVDVNHSRQVPVEEKLIEIEVSTREDENSSDQQVMAPNVGDNVQMSHHHQDTQSETRQDSGTTLSQESNLQSRQDANLQGQDSAIHHPGHQPSSQQHHPSNHLQQQSQDGDMQHHPQTGQLLHQPQVPLQHHSIGHLHQHQEVAISHSQDTQLVPPTMQHHRRIIPGPPHPQINVQSIHHHLQHHGTMASVVHPQQLEGHLNNALHPLQVSMALQHPQIDLRQLPLAPQHDNQFQITAPYQMYHHYQNQ